jgi:tetraacyldisaccharide 4'-kinase
MSRFVERFWRGELGWRGRALAAALAPAELVFRAGVRVRNASYERGVRSNTIVHAGVPVVSVGSLLVGGAGKTPFARWVVEHYLAQGIKPGVLHGGYANDEPRLHRLWHPDVPVIADRDRVAGARTAIRAGARVLVLDDGFQHRRLGRDLDIVLVPVESWVAHPHLLPVGAWRESPRALRRADVIVLTNHSADPEAIAGVWRAVAENAKGSTIEVVSLQPVGWRSWKTGESVRPASGIAVAAIANPVLFIADAVRAGGAFDQTLLFRDHHPYTREDAERIRAAARGRPILTTEKDAVKLGAVALDLELFVLEQEIVFQHHDGSAVLARLLDKLVAR